MQNLNDVYIRMLRAATSARMPEEVWGQAALGVIRMSGPETRRILGEFFRPLNGTRELHGSRGLRLVAVRAVFQAALGARMAPAAHRRESSILQCVTASGNGKPTFVRSS